MLRRSADGLRRPIGYPTVAAALAIAVALSGCAGTVELSGRAPAAQTPTVGVAEPDATPAPTSIPTVPPASTTTSATPTPQPTPTPTPVPVDPVDWSTCGRLECAEVEVPLDYRSGGTDRVTIALRRHRASGRRIGVLLVNPGGPGGSGTAFVPAVVAASDTLAERFDIVGWDPRGVADSVELRCDDPLHTFYALDSSPDDAAEQDALEDAAAAAADACAESAPALLETLDTSVAVDDLDVIRLALGEETISYLGFSYGTDIGLVYAARYGSHLRAAVLDGVLDPTIDLETWLRGQAVATEETLSRILGEGLDTFDALLAAAEAGDVEVPPVDVTRAAISATYRSDGGTWLRDALQSALDGDPGAISRLAASYLASDTFDVYTAVSCADRPHPATADDYEEMARRLAEAAPRVGAAVANELLPCAFWPVAGRPPIPELQQGDAPPLVLLGNTGDSATPYEATLEVVAELPESVLVTYQGEGHTSFFSGSPCVTSAVEDYLVELDLPAVDTRCS